jgi:hypothetical protein
LSIAGDRWVACIEGYDLALHDLASGGVQRIEAGGNYAIAGDVLVVFDPALGFRRFVCAQDTWVEECRFPLRVPGEWATSLVLSPSGASLCVEVPGERQAGHVALLDARDGSVRALLPYSLSARATFCRRNGSEILFLSAPVYMDVRVLDATDGRVLGAFDATTSWDFCHTDYDLSPDGTRLVTFGCVWACPYEVRLYGDRAITGDLTLVFRQEEELDGELVLATRFRPTADGCLSVVSLVGPREPGPEESGELVEAARALGGRPGLLVRRVDPVAGRVVGWCLAPIPRTCESRVHLLADHRVIVADGDVREVDGVTGEVRELATFDKPSSWYQTAVTSDGRTLVVRSVE